MIKQPTNRRLISIYSERAEIRNYLSALNRKADRNKIKFCFADSLPPMRVIHCERKQKVVLISVSLILFSLMVPTEPCQVKHSVV